MTPFSGEVMTDGWPDSGPQGHDRQHCCIIQLSQIWIRPLGESMNANERHSFRVAHLFTRGASLCQDKMQAGCH